MRETHEAELKEAKKESEDQMTASDRLKHRLKTGTLGGDQDSRDVEQVIASCENLRKELHEQLIEDRRQLKLAADLRAALAQKTRECQELRNALDRFNGIAPCGHEWKFVDRRGDEFQECFQCQVEQLGRQVAELQDANKEANARLQRIDDWCRAYPLDVFPEPDLEADRRLLGDGEFTRLNAHSMRHVVNGIAKIAFLARTSNKEEGC